MFNFLSNLTLKFNINLIWILFFFNFLPLTFLYFNLYLFLIIWLSIYYFNWQKNDSFFSFNSFYIYLSYLSSLVLNRWFFFYIVSKITFFWNNFFLNKLCFFFKLRFFNYKWNPVIKQYSYYGYFKSNQPRWNFSHSDEIKHYKF